MENSLKLSKLELGEIMGGYSSEQTEHSHFTYGWNYVITGNADVEKCGDAVADNCCE